MKTKKNIVEMNVSPVENENLQSFCDALLSKELFQDILGQIKEKSFEGLMVFLDYKIVDKTLNISKIKIAIENENIQLSQDQHSELNQSKELTSFSIQMPGDETQPQTQDQKEEDDEEEIDDEEEEEEEEEEKIITEDKSEEEVIEREETTIDKKIKDDYSEKCTLIEEGEKGNNISKFT